MERAGCANQIAAGFPEARERAPLMRRVGENAVAGQPVGNRVIASDKDGDTLTYSLRGVGDRSDRRRVIQDVHHRPGDGTDFLGCRDEPEL